MKQKIVLLLFLLFGWMLHAEAQRLVKGKVTDEKTGEGLPNVSVVEKGSGKGTVTDANGQFSLSVTDPATLVFSFVSYETQTVNVGSRSELTVLLKVSTCSKMSLWWDMVFRKKPT